MRFAAGQRDLGRYLSEWLERPAMEGGDIRRRLRNVLGLRATDFDRVLHVQSIASRGTP